MITVFFSPIVQEINMSNFYEEIKSKANEPLDSDILFIKDEMRKQANKKFRSYTFRSNKNCHYLYKIACYFKGQGFEALIRPYKFPFWKFWEIFSNEIEIIITW
jgi:hypothetical protein